MHRLSQGVGYLMAIDDLDLEFEDEEEKAKGDALDVDVDLTFSASPESELGGAVKKMRQKPTPKRKPVPKEESNNVSDIEQARKRSAPQAKPVAQSQPTPDYDYADEVEELRAEVQALKAKITAIEHQAEVKVAVAEAEKEYLVEYVSNAKVLDHQVTQMLQRINAKVPQLKGEVQMIKKHMNEFLAKTRPKKKE
jgi:hypothetical protein